MRQDEVIKKAEMFCTENDISDFPVEIIKICKENGLLVYEEYMEPGISGIIVVDDKVWEKYQSKQFILVNLADSAARRRFTIAHELAHYVLHREGDNLYAHRDYTDDGAVQNQIEREANLFAANVLMPENLIKKKVSEIKSSIRGILPGFVLTREIADHFVVSEAAARVRLKQLGII